MSVFQTFDPAQVLVTFQGTPIVGFADGTFAAAERNEDSVKLSVGSQGESARAMTRDKSGKVTLTLMATSPSNDFLSGAHQADQLAGLGHGPLQVKDASGRTLLLAAEAWIMKPPKVEFGREVGTREWVFETGSLDMTIGGNGL